MQEIILSDLYLFLEDTGKFIKYLDHLKLSPSHIKLAFKIVIQFLKFHLLGQYELLLLIYIGLNYLLKSNKNAMRYEIVMCRFSNVETHSALLAGKHHTCKKLNVDKNISN